MIPIEWEMQLYNRWWNEKGTDNEWRNRLTKEEKRLVAEWDEWEETVVQEVCTKIMILCKKSKTKLKRRNKE